MLLFIKTVLLAVCNACTSLTQHAEGKEVLH